MLFNSHVFIFVFLPIVWILYFGLNRFKLYKTAQIALIVSSFFFYGFEDWRLCLLLLSTVVVNYILHVFLTGKPSKVVKTLLLTLGIVFNIGLLFYFKYLNFSLDIINRLFATDFFFREIALPLGISFFTFQQVSMLVDSARTEMKTYRFLDYALYVSYFPQLIAGPIVLHQELIPQFHDEEKKKINYANLTSGIEYFILGFAKKVLVADSFARICDAGYAKIDSLNIYSTILVILAFTLQIYFDFSGYCDMAKGLGRMFNFELPINFNAPYKSKSIDEFWERWHITLSRFLTQYLYIPLGGNRKGTLRTYINIMIVFSISGLWHGADWTFILWGIMHGCAKVFYRFGKKVIDKIPGWIRWSVTFVFVNLTWVFFRADYFRQALQLLKRLIIGGGGFGHADMISSFCDTSVIMTVTKHLLPQNAFTTVQQIWLLLWFAACTLICIKAPSSHEMIEKKNRSNKWFIYLGILFFLSFIGLSQISKFIYFNF